MSDPINPFESEQRGDANPTRSADPIKPSWLTNPYADEHYLVAEEPAPVIHQERLFSRRVLFGWALATLVAIFAITVILPMVVPLVKQTVIERVVGRMQQRGMTVRVNGHTVEPVVPDVPAAPAIAGEPTPAITPTSGSPATAPSPATSGHHRKAPAPASSGRR